MTRAWEQLPWWRGAEPILHNTLNKTIIPLALSPLLGPAVKCPPAGVSYTRRQREALTIVFRISHVHSERPTVLRASPLHHIGSITRINNVSFQLNILLLKR